MINYSENLGAIIFAVRVAARASKSEIVGAHGGALKVRIAAPPVDGAANAELIKFFAKFFDVAKAQVEIMAGQTSKTKQIKIVGLSTEKFLQVADLK